MAVQRLLHVAQQRQSKSAQHANEDLCQALPFPFKCIQLENAAFDKTQT